MEERWLSEGHDADTGDKEWEEGQGDTQRVTR